MRVGAGSLRRPVFVSVCTTFTGKPRETYDCIEGDERQPAWPKMIFLRLYNGMCIHRASETTQPRLFYR